MEPEFHIGTLALCNQKSHRKRYGKLLVNQMLFSIINEIKQSVKEDCSIWNPYGRCLATTNEDIDIFREDIEKFLQEEGQRFYISEKGAYFSIQDEGERIGVFVIHRAIENVEIIGELCVRQIELAKQFHEKRVDKNKFYQQLLLDNLLLVDIYNQGSKLHLDQECKRVVFLIEPKKQKDNVVLETVENLYVSDSQDYVTSIDEGRIVLIKTLETTEADQEADEIAKAIVDILASEVMVDARIAYGTVVEELKNVSKSYKEANMALDVGKIFYEDRNVLAYNDLGIGRLIHQLPVSLCEMFLQEVFKGNAIEQFDKETLMTVNAFFENNLNVSETARQMYLHRNTLGYRLEKIMKTTGLDVKKFDDALTFKIAMMVSDHMKFIKSREQI